MTGIKLGINIDSLAAQSELNQSTSALTTSYERLSSGLRINQASDDAAGLAVASELDGKTRIYTQATRNLNDGISALQVESSALDSLMQITIRQKELATEAANGTLSQTQRTAVDNEAQALASEFNRIVTTTSYNNNQLLASPNTISIQAGIGAAEKLQATLGASLAYTTTTSGSGTSASVSGGTDESVLLSNFTLGQADQVVNFSNGSSFSSGDHFAINTQGGPIVVWYNVNNGGGDPGYGNEIEVDISSGDTAADITSETVDAMNSSGAYGYGMIFDVNDYGNYAGFYLEPEIGYTGLTNVVGAGISDGGYGMDNPPTIGMTTFGYGAYFDISTPTQKYYVWTDVLGASSDPGGTGYGIQVGINPFDDAQTIASEIASAITSAAGGSFSASADGSGNLTITSKAWGPPAAAWGNVDTGLSVSVLATGANPAGINVGTDVFTAANHGFSTGDAVTVSLNGGGTLPAPLSTATTYYIIKVDNNNFKLATSAANAQSNTAINITSVGSLYSSLTFTSGSSSTSVQTTYAQSFSLLTQSSALSALDTLESQFQRVSAEQSSIGAYMSTFSTQLSVVQERSDEYAAAESQIMDADVASETSNLVRNQILQQSAAAILAQANQEPELVLKLLS